MTETTPPAHRGLLLLLLLLSFTASRVEGLQVPMHSPSKTVPGTTAGGGLGERIATHARDFWAVSNRTGADDVLHYAREPGTGWTFKGSSTFSPESLGVAVDIDGSTVIRVVDNKVQVIRYTPAGAVSDHTDLAAVPATSVTAVAVDGDVAAYGIWGGVEGSVELFQWNGVLWSYLGAVTGPGSLSGFGSAGLALEGDFLFVGVPRYESALTGEVQVFARDPGMSCGEPYCPFGTPLEAPGGEGANLFGQALAVDGEWLAVGAPRDDFTGILPSLSREDCGIVYLYRFDGASWVYSDFVRFAGFDTDDHFGSSVDLWNHSLVVGAPDDDVEDEFTYANAGSAHVFLWNGDDWVETTFLRGGGLTVGDRVGKDVSVGPYGVQAGAPGEDVGASDGGAVHFFDNALWIFNDGFESGDSSAWSP